MKRQHAYKIITRTIDILPILTPLIVMSFGVAAMVFLLMDSYRLELILPLAVLLSLLLTWGVFKYIPREPISKERKICNGAVLVAVTLWIGWNGMLTSQHLFINRDPGIYTNAAIWLVNHDNLKPELVTEFESIEGITVNSNGFGYATDKQTLNAQGLHVLPALLAVGGRIFGINVMLHLNILFGASALLAVYAASRHIITPRWALLAAGVVASSLPFIYFSRDTYGEPLAATFTFGALAILGYALRAKSQLLWLLSGLLIGAGTMTRIDGYITVAAASCFVVVMLVLAVEKQRKQILFSAGWMALGVVTMAVISMLDLLLLSKGYFLSQENMMTKEFLLIVGIVMSGSVAIFFSWKTDILSSIDKNTKSYRAEIVAGTILIGSLILMSRPLWFKGYLFAREGVREANTVQSFSEYATYWVSWYVGDALFIAGIIGLAAASYLLMKRWDAYTAALTIVVLSTSILYFLFPSIYPDQIWGSRRMVPVILPGIVIFGVYVISRITDKYNVWQFFSKRVSPIAAYGTISAFLLLVPLVTARPILVNRDTVQLSYVRDVCRALPNDAIVIWPLRLSGKLNMPTRGLCNVPAVGFGARDVLSESNLKKLASSAHKSGKTAVIGMDTNMVEAIQVRDIKFKSILITEYNYLELEHRMVGAPQTMVPVTGKLYLAELKLDGSLISLEAALSDKNRQPDL